MIGHVEEVCALAARPAQGGPGQFLTAGHDRMIHLWDSFSHAVIWSFDLGEQKQKVLSPVSAGAVLGMYSWQGWSWVRYNICISKSNTKYKKYKSYNFLCKFSKT